MVRPTASSCSVFGVPRESQYHLLLLPPFVAAVNQCYSAEILYSCTAAAAAGQCFRLLPGTWYRWYVPVCVIVACLLNAFRWACLSRWVRPGRLCLHFGALWSLLRASSVQAWTLARAAQHSFTLVCLDCHTVIQPGRRYLLVRPGPAGCIFTLLDNHTKMSSLDQSRLYVLFQMRNKARFSVVLVFRIFAEIWSVIRRIHPCTISILPYFSSQCTSRSRLDYTGTYYN